MTKCSVCAQDAIAYAQVFRSRKKIGSFPVCFTHAAWGYGFERLGQDWVRSEFARDFAVRKGRLPRVKMSMTE